MRHSLIDRILRNPYEFSLFQAIHIIQKAHPESDRIGTFGKPGNESVRLNNVCSLVFPSSEVEAVEKVDNGEGKHYRIETPVLGLYGVFSPLPILYTASILSFQAEGEEARRRQRDFLDIFNHRLLSLYYRVDEYRHLQRTYAGEKENRFVRAIFSLIGLAGDEVRDNQGSWMFSSFSLDRLLATGTKSAGGLKAWLKDHFPDIGINVIQFCPRWVRIPPDEQGLLGKQNCSLGGGGDQAGSRGGTTIGEWLLDNETKFRVALGPLDWRKYIDFLPMGKSFGDLVRLISFFTPDWLDYDVMVKLAAAECNNLQVCLDGKTSQLGYTTGLFSDDGSDNDLSLVLEIDLAA